MVVCSSDYEKKKLDFTQYLHNQQANVYININVHTDKHVICVYLGVNETKVNSQIIRHDDNLFTMR